MKAILSTSGWAANAAPAVSPSPVTILTTPCGEAGFLDQFAQRRRAQRRLLGRLEHDGAARRQGRAEFPGGHQEGEVPRDDLPDHADRLAGRVAEELAAGHIGHGDGKGLAVDLGGPAGHVAEEVHGQWDVGRPGHGQRLAVVERFQFGELVGVFFQQVAQLPDQTAALRGCHSGPRPRLQRPPGGMNRGVDIGLIARRRNGR